MARLRVLKHNSAFCESCGEKNFTHYGPFEGTETQISRGHTYCETHFTHYGPFEGTETSAALSDTDSQENFTHYGPFEGTETPKHWESSRCLPDISLTMARLRVLKPLLPKTAAPKPTHFTHYGPFEGTETM